MASWRAKIAGGIVSILVMAAPALAVVETAKRADSFINSIGINTHFGNGIFTGGNAYADRRIDAKLGELGIRAIRDHSYNQTGLDLVGNLYTTYGIRANLILGETTRSPSDIVALLKANPAYEAVEGLNEPDLNNRSYNGFTDVRTANDFTATKAYQNDLYAAVKGDPLTAGVKILSPAMSRSNKSGFLQPINFDIAAMHSYPWATPNTRASEPSYGVTQAIADMAGLRGSKPLWATETGYYTKPDGNSKTVSENAAGKYAPRLYGEFFNRGVERTYIYELADQGSDTTLREQNFGLLRYDMTEKPAYTAIKNMIELLKEPAGSFTPTSLNYTITAPATVSRTLLQKSSGKFYMLLWNEVLSYDSNTATELNIADVAVTLALGGQFDTRIYEPNISTNAQSTFFNTNQITLGVPDQMMIVELTQVPEPTAIAAIGAIAILALRRRR
jgi:hypothetical protein